MYVRLYWVIYDGRTTTLQYTCLIYLLAIILMLLMHGCSIYYYEPWNPNFRHEVSIRLPHPWWIIIWLLPIIQPRLVSIASTHHPVPFGLYCFYPSSAPFGFYCSYPSSSPVWLLLLLPIIQPRLVSVASTHHPAPFGFYCFYPSSSPVWFLLLLPIIQYCLVSIASTHHPVPFGFYCLCPSSSTVWFLLLLPIIQSC